MDRKRWEVLEASSLSHALWKHQGFSGVGQCCPEKNNRDVGLREGMIGGMKARVVLKICCFSA